MAKKSKKLKFTRKSALISAVTVVVIVGLGLGWHYHNRPSQQVTAPPTATDKSDSKSAGTYVNLSPPTAADQQASTDAKNSAAQQSSSPAPTGSDGKKQVTVSISSGNSNPVHALVTGVFEDGGTCTATATSSSGSSPVTNTSTGFGNSNYTTCPPITLSLGSGTWSVVVTYSSSTSEGTSSATTIQVP